MIEEFLSFFDYWFRHCQRKDGKGKEENIENEEEDPDQEEE